MAALVIAIAMTLWILAQWLGPKIGIEGRYAFLVDFAALAAFAWAFIVTIGVWRARRDEG